jgi:hypothetical protein
MNLKSAMRDAVQKKLGGDKAVETGKPSSATVAAIKALKAAKSEEQEAEAYKLLVDSLKD